MGEHEYETDDGVRYSYTDLADTETAENAEALADGDGFISDEDMLSLTTDPDFAYGMTVGRFLEDVLHFERLDDDDDG